MFEIKYVPGKTLDTCYFVASEDDKEDVVFRATQIIDPKLHEQAIADDSKVQPEQYVEQLKAQCKSLEEFQQVGIELAASHNVKAAQDVPTMATEPVTVPKAQAKPEAAAEQPYTTEQKTRGGDGKVRRLFARLPAKGVGGPEQAVDEKFVKASGNGKVHASVEVTGAIKMTEEERQEMVATLQEVWSRLREKGVPMDLISTESLNTAICALQNLVITGATKMTDEAVALREELARKAAEVEQLKKEKDDMAKDGRLTKILKMLADVGIAKDEKGKERFKKLLAGLNEPALNVVEQILEEVMECVEEAEEGEGKPKPPSKPPVAKKEDDLMEKANITSTPLQTVTASASGIAELSNLMLTVERSRELAGKGLN